MKQLPRNVKIGPSRMPLCEADDADDPFDTEHWDESFSVTPPPVAVTERRRKTRPSTPKVEPVPSSGHGMFIWAAMIVGIAVALSVSYLKTPPRQTAVALRAWVSEIPKIDAAAWVQSNKVDLGSLVRQRRADANLRHDGYASIPGGVLYTPESFNSSDGSFDLLLHFHGNVKIVVESAVAAKLNAAVAVVNLGVGSARYQDFYAAPGMYEELLGHIRAAMQRRGLEKPRIRRVALSAWSAGYGAISTILMEREGRDPLDAILVLDGIHTSYKAGHPGELLERRLAPFDEAAHAAASGDLLFTITYSEIDPPGYAGTRATAEHLVGVARSHGEIVSKEPSVPASLKLVSMRGAVSKEDARRLEPIDDRRVGDFHVRGFRGNTRGDHMAHLFQMGSTVLPELVRRWNSYAGYAGRADAVRAERARFRARNSK
jgi:hypothetical protein